jgi:hypothetical protein
MASISVGGNVNISSLYSEPPLPTYIPFYSDFPVKGFRNSLILYDQFTQAVSIGAIANFDDAANLATIGIQSSSNSYVKIDTASNDLILAAATIRINNITLSGTGGSPSLHLPVIINGTAYKIQLLS